MSRDRRRFARYVTTGLTGTLSAGEPFEALRVSRGGLLMRLEREARLDETLAGELRLDQRPLPFRGGVVFVGRDLGAGNEAYRIGIAFSDLAPEDADLLEQVVAERYPAE